MKKAGRIFVKAYLIALLATALFFIFGCEKEEVERGENCLCSEAAKETNSDFCKQLCYYLGS